MVTIFNKLRVRQKRRELFAISDDIRYQSYKWRKQIKQFSNPQAMAMRREAIIKWKDI